MPLNQFTTNLLEELETLNRKVSLLVVSKYQTVEDIVNLYNSGLRLFGESKVEELAVKAEELPKDIEWHFIGHLQRNKVAKLLPIVKLIHSVDSQRLLIKINQESQKQNIITSVLLQIHIAQETAKFGFLPSEVRELFEKVDLNTFQNINFCGLMGMATNTENTQMIEQEFSQVNSLFDELRNGIFRNHLSFSQCSMGMSGDYKIAINQGSTILRIGSNIFK